MKIRGITLWIIVGLVIVAGVVFGMRYLRTRTDGKAYQAVFLTNGQVYFGHVTNERGNPIVLHDVFYLLVQKQLQPDEQTDKNQTPQIQLVKLGNELHGPQDEMRINHDQVLFVEDLKDDSKVSQAIKQYKENPPATATPSATPTVQASTSAPAPSPSTTSPKK